MPIPRRSMGPRLGGSSGKPETSSKPATSSTVNSRPLQTSSSETFGRPILGVDRPHFSERPWLDNVKDTISLHYSPATAPPPLPPPPRIHDLENGYDAGWLYANSSRSTTSLPPINPNSSLLGGHRRPDSAPRSDRPVTAQTVNRLKLLTRQPHAAPPQMEPGPPGKYRNWPHRMNMSITARKTIKTISDDISCERTQKKRKLNALLMNQRRQEKVSRSYGKPRETTTRHFWGHQDLRPISPSLIDRSRVWAVEDFGVRVGKKKVSPHGSLSPPGVNSFMRDKHEMNNFGDYDTHQLHPLPVTPPFVTVIDEDRTKPAVKYPKGTPDRFRTPHLPETQTQTRHGDSVLMSYLGPDLPEVAVHARNYLYSDWLPKQDPLPVENEHSQRGQHKCEYPNCGRYLRPHMLSHQTERPEKCPIETCEYPIKGFARKYDKNRHNLTHFKGTLVCGFCRGAGFAAEKSFVRADVFKHHLTSVHGVDQTLPGNCKGKISGSTSVHPGKCSVCTTRFGSAQSFYDHLDDCVMNKVLQQQHSNNIQKWARGLHG
ncbi:uncharacterized protein N7503_004552 [Penicillium pulvis]|uniref:uncharacterized protein n=1 Tax=Penicillium pulvis TaxID=1562058 RepID=UPI00254722E7|nr:uncharacterized protein N7503_004552 [Penicillium pulvis]KAJ5802102.1 hypothetical protein N7503_004552 [Penicillium pulvis]